MLTIKINQFMIHLIIINSTKGESLMTIVNIMPKFDGDFFSMKFIDEETNIPVELDYNKTEFGEHYRILVEILITRIHIVGMAVGEFYIDIYNGFDHQKLIFFAKERLNVQHLSDDVVFHMIMSIILETLYVEKIVDDKFYENVEICLDMLQYMDSH